MSSLSRFPPRGHRFVGELGDTRFDSIVERAWVFAISTPQGFTEGNRGSTRRWSALALAQNSPGSLDVNGHDGDVRPLGNKGCSTSEGLPPAIRATATLGEDDERPTLRDEVAREIGRGAADSRSIDRDRANHECGERARDPRAKEIVRGGSDNRAVTPRCREGTEKKRRVDMAVMVGCEHGGPAMTIEAIGATDRWLSQARHDGPDDAVDDDGACHPSWLTAGPIGREVGAGHAPLRGDLDRLGNGRRGVGERQRGEWPTQAAYEGNLSASEALREASAVLRDGGHRCYFTSAISIGGLW